MSRARDLYEYLKEKGEHGIKEIIDPKDPWTEYLFVDYKRSKRQREVGPVNDDDRKNLAKAISGFGNSSGGLIVWGVKCKKGPDGVDIPTKATPLKEVVKFRSQLEGLISGFTIPAHNGVENETIRVNDDGAGYLLTFIPKSDYAPLRSLKHDQYFLRSGSSFQPVPHDALAGMFGKRPEPRLKLLSHPGRFQFANQNTLRFERVYSLKNDGVAMVDDVFFTFELSKTVGPSTEVKILPYGDSVRIHPGTPSETISLVTNDDFRLAPGVARYIYTIHILLRYPIESCLEVTVHYGCEGSRIHTFKYVKEQDFYKRVYDFGLGGWDPRLERDWNMHVERHLEALHEANKNAFDTTIDIPMLS